MRRTILTPAALAIITPPIAVVVSLLPTLAVVCSNRMSLHLHRA
jgi:hypothetical protein